MLTPKNNLQPNPIAIRDALQTIVCLAHIHGHEKETWAAVQKIVVEVEKIEVALDGGVVRSW